MRFTQLSPRRLLAQRSNASVDYRSIFENSVVGIFRLDLERQCFVMANAALARILGYPSEAALRSSVVPVVERLLVEPSDREILSKRCEEGLPAEIEAQVYCEDGSKRWVMVSLVPIGGGEEAPRLCDGVLYDIGARKQAQASTRRLSARLLQVQDEQRRRLGRELHDSTGQDLAAAEMNLVQLESSVSDALGEQDRKFLSESVSLIRRASQQARSMSYLLHPPLLDELGLEVALRDFIEGFSKRSGILVESEVSPEVGRLGSDIETALFRIVQECLVNVQRHSMSPSADVRLMTEDSIVRLEVRDRGRGIDPPELSGEHEDSVATLGVGIRGMRERMHQLGGRLDIETGLWGTIVRAEVPYESGGRR